MREMHLFRLDIFCFLASRHLGSHCDCCWHTLYFNFFGIHFPVELVHEGDASFLAEHLLVTCHTLLGTVFVIGSLHKLSSVMMHEGDASFLVGHLLVASIASP